MVSGLGKALLRPQVNKKILMALNIIPDTKKSSFFIVVSSSVMKISSVHGRSHKLTILVLSYSPPTIMSLPVAKEDALFPLSRADPEVWAEQVWSQEEGP